MQSSHHTSCLQAVTVCLHGYRHYFLIGSGGLCQRLTHHSNRLVAITKQQCMTDEQLLHCCCYKKNTTGNLNENTCANVMHSNFHISTFCMSLIYFMMCKSILELISDFSHHFPNETLPPLPVVHLIISLLFIACRFKSHIGYCIWSKSVWYHVNILINHFQCCKVTVRFL